MWPRKDDEATRNSINELRVIHVAAFNMSRGRDLGNLGRMGRPLVRDRKSR